MDRMLVAATEAHILRCWSAAVGLHVSDSKQNLDSMVNLIFLNNVTSGAS